MDTAVASAIERLARRLGAACVLAGAAAWGWALLARQAPTSPLHLAGAPPAIEQLATRAWLVGLAVCVLGPGTVRSLEAGRAKGVVWVSLVGCALSLGAMAVAAALEVPGVQLVGAQGAGRWLAYARVLGDGALVGALAVALRAWVREEKSP